MKMERVRVLVLTVSLWFGLPLPAVQAADLSTQDLITQVVEAEDDIRAARACKALRERLRRASAEELTAMRNALAAPFVVAEDPDRIRRIGFLLAARPDVDWIWQAAWRLDAARAAGPQAALCDVLAKSLSRLDGAQRDALAAEMAGRMSRIIAKPGQAEPVMRAAVRCLGALGRDGCTALAAIARQPAICKVVGDALPAALVETREPMALECLVERFDHAQGLGNRAACVHALGCLIHALAKAGVPVSAQVRQGAIDRIRASLRSDADREMLAVSIRAAALAIGVDNDEALRQTTLAAVGHADADVRAAALEAIVGTRTAQAPEVRQAAAALRTAESSPLARAAAGAVLDAVDAED